MASTVVKAVIGSKVKSLTEDVEGRYARPLPETSINFTYSIMREREPRVQ